MSLEPTAEQRLREVKQVLRGLIAERGFSLREIDRRLGRSGGYTNQALRGKFQLTVLHVFQILAALEVPPEELYLRLLGRSTNLPLLNTDLNREMLKSIRRAGELAAQLQALQPRSRAGEDRRERREPSWRRREGRGK
jgi:hypothetical protein